MFFSPISERSRRVRLIYSAIYFLLSLGGISMIVPFVIMISGSLESSANFSDSVYFPRYLTDQDALWRRFLEAKYHGNVGNLRMAWSDESADYRDSRVGGLASADTKLWEEYCRDHPSDEILRTVGFVRSSPRTPSFYGREFRNWLMKEFGDDLSGLNRELGTHYGAPSAINVPSVSIGGASIELTPLVARFYEFSKSVPEIRKFAWDAGGYYRSVFLPRMLGHDIAAFNEKYATFYKSYSEVPFSSQRPSIAEDLWHLYVTRELRPDFVQLTEAGTHRQREAGLGKDEFIQLKAETGDLRVASLDRLFADWAMQTRGISDARIPQQTLDQREFAQEQRFWKRQFLTLNYLTVIDEVALHGRAIGNTIILVVLSVCGALIVNPLAAYALSRFKMRYTYHILIFCLATIAFPAEVKMLPVFLQLKEFHLLNTFGALVIPGLANGFSIFLLKGFFDSLPRELYEAAEIDGASEWVMFWMITMNLSKPILAVTALGAFVSAYGAFFYALIVAPDPRIWTIMVYIYQLRQMVETPVVYASLILSAIPTLLVFVFCQNIILRGIVVPSEK